MSGRNSNNDERNSGRRTISLVGSGPNYKDQMREAVVHGVDAAGITTREAEPERGTTAVTTTTTTTSVVDHSTSKSALRFPFLSPADVVLRGPGYKDQMREAALEEAMPEAGRVVPTDADASSLPAGPRYKDQMREALETAEAAGSVRTDADDSSLLAGPRYKDQMREALETAEAAGSVPTDASSLIDKNNNDKKKPAATAGRPALPVAVPVNPSVILEEEQAERLQRAEVVAREAERQRVETELKLVTNKKTTKKRACYAALVVALLGVATVAGVCGSGKCQSRNDEGNDTEEPTPPPTTDRPTRSPTTKPTKSPTPLSGEDRAVLEYINSISLTGRNLTYPDRESPEGLALIWLIDEDTISSTASDETLLALRQRYALATLWNQGTGVENNLFGRWNSLLGECNWEHVKCDESSDKIITSLILTGSEIQGRIPVEIGLLTGLTYLDFTSNQIVGAIPTSLRRLTDLTDLRLYNNQINGTMPFCDVNQTFTTLVADCDQVECPCCTHCCPADDSNPAIPSNWTVQCVA